MTHSLDTPVDEWHVYQTWWTPTEIAIGVDGTREDAHLVYTKPDGADNDAWPFDGPMDLIMNITIGGTLGGSAPTGDFSYNMLVDYVRIYQTGRLPGVFDGLTFSAESTVGHSRAPQQPPLPTTQMAQRKATMSFATLRHRHQSHMLASLLELGLLG